MPGYRSHLGFWFGGLNAEAPEENAFDECNPDAGSVGWAACSTQTTTWAQQSARSTTWDNG